MVDKNKIAGKNDTSVNAVKDTYSAEINDKGEIVGVFKSSGKNTKLRLKAGNIIKKLTEEELAEYKAGIKPKERVTALGRLAKRVSLLEQEMEELKKGGK